MSQKTVCVYTDGACSRNPGYGAWAFIVLVGNKIYVSRSGSVQRTTNNRMELTAVIEALSFVLEDKKLRSSRIHVYTDSQYVQRGATEWISLWKERRWRNSDRVAVKNRELWEKLDALNEELAVEWFWVRGHAGNEYNEMCDAMSKKEIAALAEKLGAEQ